MKALSLQEKIQLTEDKRHHWNDFVAQSRHFALMQSYEWGEFKEQLGWQVIRVAITEGEQIVAGAQVLIRSLPFNLASFAYIPRGPLVDWEDTGTVDILLKGLHDIAEQHRVLFLRIEPPLLHSDRSHLLLKEYGFVATTHTNQPRCTLILDLEPALEDLFAGLPKQTRYHIRSCRRKGVISRQVAGEGLPIFYHLMQVTGKRAGFSTRSREYYDQEYNTFAPYDRVALFLADFADTTLAAEMPFCFGKNGAAFHGVSSDTFRQLPVSDLLTWEGIRWAKEKGCHRYDLWGIPDEVGELIAAGKPVPSNKRGGLWGVYYFKKGFGGNMVYYVGAYDYVYGKLTYTTANKLLSWLESTDFITTLLDRR